ncbi:MAG: DUF1801 domain-containing protein [Terriglobia bacterium]
MADNEGPSNGELDRLLAAHSPMVRRLACDIYRLVKSTFPVMSEKVYRGWHGIGFHHPDAGYLCAIFPMEGSVKLAFEHGATLTDPRGLLKAGPSGGKQVRYVEVRSEQDIDAEQIGVFLREALEVARPQDLG